MTIKKVDGIVLFLLTISWLVVNLTWGMTGPETLVSGWFSGIDQDSNLVITGLIILFVTAVMSWWQRSRTVLFFCLMVFSYTLGVFLSRMLLQYFDPQNIIVNRSFILIPVVPMSIVAYYFRSEIGYSFRMGNWKEPCHIPFFYSKNWQQAMVRGILLIAIPSFFLFQFGVDFEPFQSGKLGSWFPLIAGLAVLNGVAEEMLFRGLLMAPLIGLFGTKKGVWMQAIFFGFHHWGASPDLIAGLPMAIILVFIGVLFGYSVTGTKGIFWAIVLHILFDIASLSAFLPS